MLVSTVLSDLAGTSGNAFMQVKNKAAADVCLSNLKQLYVAIQMIVDENDGRLPLAWFYHNALYPQDPYSIVNIVAGRDTSLRKLFVCPAAPEAWQRTGLTYVYNDLIRGHLLDSIPHPAETWLLMDCNIMDPRFPPPHLDGYNVLFCDGHVKWFPKEAMAAIWTRPTETSQPPAGGEGGAGRDAADDE